MSKLLKQFSVGISEYNQSFSVEFPERRKSARSQSVDAHIAFLERGIPTTIHPSLALKLKKYLGAEEYNSALNDKDKFFVSNKQNWRNRIKGDDRNKYFPALDFWEKDLPKYLKKNQNLNHIFIPEVDFGSLMSGSSDLSEVSRSSQVDFFCPLADLVIEIDGRQHSEVSHQSKDDKRDEILAKNGIDVVRITTAEFRSKGSDLEKKLKQIKESLSQNDVFSKLGSFEGTNLVLAKVISTLRFQRIILEMLKIGHLPLSPKEWRLNLISRDFVDEEIFQIALLDLVDNLEIFAGVFGENFSPKLDLNKVFKGQPNCPTIDFSIAEVFDDTEHNPNYFTVRNNPTIFRYHNELKTPLDMKAISNSFGHNLRFTKAGEVNFIQKALRNCFGLDHFRNGQLEIMQGALRSKTALGLLPTGGGKSLTFQFPALLQNGCTVVVCPISALVRDHVDELKALGFSNRACYINRQIVGSERDFIHKKLINGQLKFLFVSPEQFQKKDFREFMSQSCAEGFITRFVIDEVHCLSEWGVRCGYLWDISPIDYSFSLSAS
jgi:ATP-dependent DNA helicase RecQ